MFFGVWGRFFSFYRGLLAVLCGLGRIIADYVGFLQRIVGGLWRIMWQMNWKV